MNSPAPSSEGRPSSFEGRPSSFKRTRPTLSESFAQEVFEIYNPVTVDSDTGRFPDAVSATDDNNQIKIQKVNPEIVPKEENVNPQPNPNLAIRKSIKKQRNLSNRVVASDKKAKVIAADNGTGGDNIASSKKKRTLKNTTRAMMYVSRMRQSSKSSNSSPVNVMNTSNINNANNNANTTYTTERSPITNSSNSLTPLGHHRNKSSKSSVSQNTTKVSMKSAARSILYAAKLKGKRKSLDYAATNIISDSGIIYEAEGKSIEMTIQRNSTQSSSFQQVLPRQSDNGILESERSSSVSEYARSASASTAQGKIDIVMGSLPVKDVLKGMYRTTRWKTFQGCGLWLLFLGLNTAIYSLVHDTSKIWEQQSALEELFLDEEIPESIFKKNFHDVMSKNELWDWIDGVLVPGVYPDNWYNGMKKDDNKRGYIVENTMRIVGGIRIRQHKVSSDSCYSRRFIDFINRSQPERCKGEHSICPFDRLDQSCFSDYRKDPGPVLRDIANLINMEATASPLGTITIPRYSSYNETSKNIPKRYIARRLQSDLDPALAGFGIDGTYGYIGFYQDLPASNKSAAVEILNDMKNELWLDDGTRAVAITFTVYNTMSRSATVCRFVIEFSESGRVYNRGKFYTFPLVIYGNSGASTQRSLFEAMSLVMYIYFVLKEVKKGWRLGFRGYLLKRKSTVVEVGILFVFFLYFAQFYSFVYEIVAGNTSKDFHVMSTVYKDYLNLGWQYKYFARLHGFSTIAGSFKIIKFIALSKQAMLLVRTLVAAKGTLIAYAVFFLTLWVAFAFWGQSLYGDRVWQFSKFSISMSTLFRLMLADSELNYEILFRMNAYYTPVFYFTFQFVFLVLVMNMLIAILVSQFELVKELSVSEEKWKKEVPTLMSDFSTSLNIYTYRCRHRCCRDYKALKMSESIEVARSLYAKDPAKWGEAYTESSEYWKGCKDWEFMNLVRKLAHIGKDSRTGPSVNLLELLEKLYNQWEIRSREAIENGAFGDDHTDGRMPIACISASRLLLMICNAPPAIEEVENKGILSTETENDVYQSVLSRCYSRSCSSNHLPKETPADRQRRLYSESKHCVEETIKKYNSLAEVILIAPVISDAVYWTNDEAIVGESLQMDLDDKDTANKMFRVRVSISGGGEHWETIFMDVASAQLYILTPVDKKIKSRHQVRRSMERKKTPSNLSRFASFGSTKKSSSSSSFKAESDFGIGSDETWFGKDNKSSTASSTLSSVSKMEIRRDSIMSASERNKVKKHKLNSKYYDDNGALWQTQTTGGRIKRVLDMLDLQQMHVDRIDLNVVTLYFEDSVGASFCLRFHSFERRRDFLVQVMEVARRIKNGNGWGAEDEEQEVSHDKINSESYTTSTMKTPSHDGGIRTGGSRSSVARRALRRNSQRESDIERDLYNGLQEPQIKKSKNKSIPTKKSGNNKLVLPAQTKIFKSLAEEVKDINSGENMISDIADGFKVTNFKESTKANKRNRRRSVLPGSASRRRTKRTSVLALK